MAEPLKNMYNAEFVDELGSVLKSIHAPFDTDLLQERVFDDQWNQRELKHRSRHIAEVLQDLLPQDYPEAVRIISEAVEKLSHYSYHLMIFPDFIELFGLNDWETSLPAMAYITKHISAEFAVRPFIMQDQDRMMQQMLAWSQDENHHVRRLSSEGCRSRLPWGVSLPEFKNDPTPILPILENLKDDSSEYVRRSVANNLNDITKDNPQVVLEIASRWLKNTTEERKWIINHALRSMVKAGSPEALSLLGFPASPQVKLVDFQITPGSVRVGDEIQIICEVESTSSEPQSLMIDYLVYHVRANGKQTSKVFKLTKRTLEPGKRIQLTKKHSFAEISTRRYYPGIHALSIQINGQEFPKVEFTLNPL